MKHFKEVALLIVVSLVVYVILMFHKNDPVGTIKIDSAEYGQYVGVWALIKPACDATAAVSKICNGKVECSLTPSDQLCTIPQKTPPKLLIVKFHCEPEDSVPKGLRVINIGENKEGCLRCLNVYEKSDQCRD